MFQEEFLTRVTDESDPAEAGAAELHLHDDGTVYCHLAVSWPVEVYEPGDVPTTVGIDLNIDPLVVGAVVTEDEVEDVEFLSGAEFRHHRDRIKQRHADTQAAGALGSVRTRVEYHRYIDHVTNVASRRVVDLAVEYAPTVIHLEDLTGYRETADDPHHEWPFADIQSKIADKATEEGLPVRIVDPAETSVTCRQCGVVDHEARDGREFHCEACGYQVHADLNAAINIALSE